MSWTGVWIGVALLLGFYLGGAVVSRDSGSEGGRRYRLRADRRSRPC